MCLWECMVVLFAGERDVVVVTVWKLIKHVANMNHWIVQLDKMWEISY